MHRLKAAHFDRVRDVQTPDVQTPDEDVADDAPVEVVTNSAADVLELTAASAIDAIREEADAQTLDELFELEESGKARKTVLAAIETRIEELDP